jgi:cell division transport system permease protein
MSERPTSAVRRPSWLRRVQYKHRSALRAACAHLVERPFAHAFALALLAIALFALLLLRLGMDQFERLGSPLAGARSLSLFLDTGIDQGGAAALARELAADARVARVDPVSPAQGLAELSQLGGSDDALAALPENPLPWVLAVEPTDRDAGAAVLEDWSRRPEVEYIADEHEWQARADTVLAAARVLGWVLLLTVAAAAILLAANAVRTIRVEGAEERALQRVFGASERDLRRPYVYLGLLYGLIAGTLAVALVLLVSWTLAPALQMLAETFGATPAPAQGNGWWLVASVPAAGVLGAIGAWLGCRFEPDLEAIE